MPHEIRTLVAQTLDREAQTHLSTARYEDHIQQAKKSLKARRLEAALEHAKQALALNPSQPVPFNIMGIVMQLKMQVSEAQKYYRSALALDDAYAPARNNLEALSGFPKKLSQFELDE
jgi:Tfp pilus assembly protein PilF